MRGYSTNADGDVVLTMSREDYEDLLMSLGISQSIALRYGDVSATDRMLSLLNRLNAGNPHYTPYRTDNFPA